jgi:hypothetical protein
LFPGRRERVRRVLDQLQTVALGDGCDRGHLARQSGLE